MGQLVFNFIKRSLLIPALVAGILVAAVLYSTGEQVTLSQEKLVPAAVSPVNLSGYTQVDYTAFSQLSSGDLAGTVLCEDTGLAEHAFCYDADSSYISLERGSAEPWNGGALLLVGTDAQLRDLHGAGIGTELTLQFQNNGEYRYTVSRVVTGLRRDELTDYMADGTLCLAVSFNDLSAAAQPSYYALYIAQQS